MSTQNYGHLIIIIFIDILGHLQCIRQIKYIKCKNKPYKIELQVLVTTLFS